MEFSTSDSEMCDLDLDDKWAEIESYFDGSITELNQNFLELFNRNSVIIFICDYFFAREEYILRSKIVPFFWSAYNLEDTKTSVSDTFINTDEIRRRSDNFRECITQLSDMVNTQVNVIKRINAFYHLCHIVSNGESSYIRNYKLLLKGTLHSQLPHNFQVNVKAFYSRAFHVFNVRQDANCMTDRDIDDSVDGTDETLLQCPGCDRESNFCECNDIIGSFHLVNHCLLRLGLLERFASSVLTEIVHERILKHVTDTCTGSFVISHIRSLESWLDSVVMSWIRLLYHEAPSIENSILLDDYNTTAKMEAAVYMFRPQLLHYLYNVYTKMRIKQMFNIIVEFDESSPALEDLKECLVKTNMRSTLIFSLRNVLRIKLLHLGVNTTDILTAYVAAIRSLQVLDPTGILLDQICEPVRRYLRTREDTVRCIMQSLVDGSNSDLAEELVKREGLVTLDDTQANMGNWETWLPDPVDPVAPYPLKYGGFNAHRRPCLRTSDIISMLVNIYGSKELFVNEYRSLLSHRLLSMHNDFDTQKEIRHLELLKLRFGEGLLQQCTVMLKDVSDSKRINAHINRNGSHMSSSNLDDSDQEYNKENAALEEDEMTSSSKLPFPFPLQALIISGQFWPQFKQDSLELPLEVKRCMNQYTKAFKSLKGNRTLIWKSSLGLVNIEISIGARKTELNVSPLHATIIYLFQEKAEWSLKDISDRLKIPVSTLRRRMNFWISNGLIAENPEIVDGYVLLDKEEGIYASNKFFNRDTSSKMSSTQGGAATKSSCIINAAETHAEEDEDFDESLTKTTKDQRDEELQVFWSYIVGMLTNLVPLPLDRIYQMLKMFVMKGASGVECDPNELRSFLDTKVKNNQLIYSDGLYKLPNQ